jgi:hypothetical protein
VLDALHRKSSCMCELAPVYAEGYRVVSACTHAHGIICVCYLALKSHVVARSLAHSLALSPLSPFPPGLLTCSALSTVMLGMEPGAAPTRRCHGTGRAASSTAAFTTTCCPTPMRTSESGGARCGEPQHRRVASLGRCVGGSGALEEGHVCRGRDLARALSLSHTHSLSLSLAD